MPLLHQQTAVAWMSPVLDAIWVASDPKLVYNNKYDWSESARNSSHLKIKRAVLKPAYWQLRWTKLPTLASPRFSLLAATWFSRLDTPTCANASCMAR